MRNFHGLSRRSQLFNWHIAPVRQQRYSVSHGQRASSNGMGDETHQFTMPDWPYPIYKSNSIKAKGSTFLAHATTLNTISSVPLFIKQLEAHPSLKRATHCMWAYRYVPNLSDPTRFFHANSDGGERGAGTGLSTLVDKLECQNVILIVSRWYGGTDLGSERWRLISRVAREAIERGGMSSKMEAAKAKKLKSEEKIEESGESQTTD